MPDELLTIFKICFLILLYLFFIRVLRVVWTQVNSAAVAAPPAETRRGRKQKQKSRPAPVPPPIAAPAPPPAARSGPTRLVAMDPANLAGLEYPLVDDMTVGRAAGAGIVLDDNFMSGRHAAFEFRDGHWLVTDLGSTNGTYVNRTKVEQSTRLAIGDQVQIGNVVLEVR